MSKVFLDKVLKREFDDLSLEELSVIVAYDEVFSLNKKDKKVLEKIISSNSLDTEKEKVLKVLKGCIPPAIAILSKLDKFSINEKSIKVDFRKSILENLKQMNNFQLCVFIDRMMWFSKKYGLNFFRNKLYSIHEINTAVSKSFNLSLTFEIFKLGKYKKFLAIDHSKLDKQLLVEAINSQVVHHLCILEIISYEVLMFEEERLLGTKINKIIKTNDYFVEYLSIILRGYADVSEAKVEPKRTWTYTLSNLLEVTVEDDDCFFEEDDNE